MVMTYIRFTGCCQEAFDRYAEVFGGSVLHMAKYGDIPGETPFDEAQRKLVMHGEVMLGEHGGISGCDSLTPVTAGDNISVHAHFDDAGQAAAIAAKLAEGGSVISELVRNPPPDDAGLSGCVTDRYGVNWIISAYEPQQQ